MRTVGLCQKGRGSDSGDGSVGDFGGDASRFRAAIHASTAAE
jgi:hypothetical protein